MRSLGPIVALLATVVMSLAVAVAFKLEDRAMERALPSMVGGMGDAAGRPGPTGGTLR